MWREIHQEYIDIFPRAFIMAHTLEKIKMPENTMGLVTPLACYMGFGLHIMTPILNPGFDGYYSVGLANLSPSKIRVYANEGVVRLCFIEVCEETVE
jgi:dCTP deaminase